MSVAMEQANTVKVEVLVDILQAHYGYIYIQIVIAIKPLLGSFRPMNPGFSDAATGGLIFGSEGPSRYWKVTGSSPNKNYVSTIFEASLYETLSAPM